MNETIRLEQELSEKGTVENPYDTIADALDASDGTGKALFVYSPNGILYIVDSKDE